MIHVFFRDLSEENSVIIIIKWIMFNCPKVVLVPWNLSIQFITVAVKNVGSHYKPALGKEFCNKLEFFRTNSRISVTNSRVFIKNLRLPVTNSRISVTNSRVSVTNSRVFVKISRIPVMNSRISMTNLKIFVKNLKISMTNLRISMTTPRISMTNLRISMTKTRGFLWQTWGFLWQTREFLWQKLEDFCDKLQGFIATWGSSEIIDLAEPPRVSQFQGNNFHPQIKRITLESKAKLSLRFYLSCSVQHQALYQRLRNDSHISRIFSRRKGQFSIC